MAGRASQCFDQWTWAALVPSSKNAKVRKESRTTTKPTTRKPKFGVERLLAGKEQYCTAQGHAGIQAAPSTEVKAGKRLDNKEEAGHG